MKVTEDGALVLHQSDIGHFMTCPEQFRVTNGIEPGGTFVKQVDMRVETDAATVGTVLHAVIEHDLSADGPFRNMTDALEWGYTHMGGLIQSYVDSGTEYRTESFGANPQGALKKLSVLVEKWFTCDERSYWISLIAHHPDQVLIENHFEVPFISNREGLYGEIRLAGTPDIVDCVNNRVVDWKTTGRDYQRWEKQRWAVQPTVYTYAAAELGWIDPSGDGTYRFDYRVFNHKNNSPQAQHVETFRGPGQWGWLVQMVSNMVDMIESSLKVWPLRDDHALCGPRWCPIWAECKGMYVNEEWE